MAVFYNVLKRLVMAHNTIIPETLDPLQFAYHTIVPSKLITKLRTLALNTFL
jgi:arylamine N-acetyltransferase